ncbi:unnamed protein product [Rangifer tarandus platyrhynchus]|uniref:Uncharacterized protein n=2 Tax=Rangifer tarandus platyrhynchus TaxID=3082113 RepID=A0ABN8XZW4_RANTA|nr:unnamed protein product [Rangifer tarandus platyrhynchus]
MCVPHPEPLTHLPPHPIPQGHPSAPALSTLSHALNLYWRSISHMMISKSLIQSSIDGWGCVPSLLFDLRPNYGGGNEENATSFKRSHAHGATLSAPDLAAGHH